MNKFYVYVYFDRSVPIYVGKGTGDRCHDHLKAALKSKKNSHFMNRLRKMAQASENPIIKIVQSMLTEQEAFDLEIALIKQYGRFDRGLGTLLNETDGGDGSSGHVSPRRGKSFDECFGAEKSAMIRERIRQKALARSDQIAEVNRRVHTGKKLSEEQINKTRLANLGKKRSQEARQRISDSTRGKQKTLTSLQRLEASRRAKELFQDTLIVNDGNQNKRIRQTELDQFLSNGWVQGRKVFNKRKQNTSFTKSEKFLKSRYKGGRKAKRCEVYGIVYPHIKAAAEANSTTAYFIKQNSTFKFLED